MSVTLDQLPQAIRDANAQLDVVKNSLRLISELQSTEVKVYIEETSDWFYFTKDQVIKFYQDRVDTAQAQVDKLHQLQELLNQTLADALNGK